MRAGGQIGETLCKNFQLHSTPHSVVLWIFFSVQEPSGRCLKTVVISVKDKEINTGPWKNISVDSQASLLHPLPLPLGGLVAIGYQTIAYYNKDVQHAIDPPIVKVRVHVYIH